ncbi:MAG TPA: ATP-binding protein [Chryseolinea sp.]|nr:ATP-binding protein [Chryseolinea sp.]
MKPFGTPLIILLISLLLPPLVIAQDKYRAVHWDLEDGLSQAETYHILKDVNGFLWIGTKGGLSRFDGSTFKNYYYDPKKTGTINATSTSGGLVEDSLHNIWIGTDKGLFRYDIKADYFSQFLPEGGLASALTFILPIWATKDTLFCLESDTIITAYNVNTLQKTKVLSLLRSDDVGNGLSGSYPYYDARSKSMWLLKGLQGRPGGGLLRISLSTGEKEFYGWSCYKKIKDHSHDAEAMCYDRKRNCLWLNSSEGLMQFTLDDKQFHYVAEVNDQLDFKKYFHYVGITLDHQNRIWFANEQKGITIYDPSDHSVTFPFEEGSAMQKEVSDANARIYVDRDGIIWSGCWLRKGIYQIIPMSPSVITYKPDSSRRDGLSVPNVINFLDIGQGKLLIGSFSGRLHIFDPRTNSFQALREKELQSARGFVVPLGVDTIAKKAIVLAAPGNALLIMDVDTKRSTALILKDSANRTVEKNLSGVRADPGLGGLIVTCIIDKKLKFFRMKWDSVEAHEMTSPVLDLLFEFDLLRNLMVGDLMFIKRSGLKNLTLTYRGNEWILRPNALDSVNWTHIVYNGKDNNFWVVVEKQLVVYNRDFKVLHTYTPKEGLPDIDIFNIIPDSRGNIWFNTDRSLHQLNIETGVFSTLSEKDGFQSLGGFTDGPPMSMSSDGNIYLGGGIFGQGFVRIIPEKYTITPSSIYVRSLEVNQEAIPLSTGVNNLQDLSLKYFQNRVALETGVIDYYSKGKGHIRYKMLGVNDDWQYEPAGYTIRYDGLVPGQYTLVMQASNAANEFIGPEKSLLIVISPPWWQTWWAYVLYTITFASLVWSFIHYRSVELKKRNVLLEEKVLQRTNDLHRSLEDLRQTQNQLIQSEKMASLGELTVGIAHEIQNPLNFVNNFSEVSNELLQEMNGAIEKGSYDEAKTLSDDVRQNLEKILHHGKRADGIVKGMLQHSRASSGHKEPTDINALCDEYLRLSYHGLRAKDKSFNAIPINIGIETNFDPTIGKLNVVSQDIGRAILNLINNAFYAVTEKSKQQHSDFEPIVSISTKKLGVKVLISVKDNGNGIPDSIKEKIFQPFFTTKPAGQGTGLGLSLSYDIVKAHGGTIRVISSDGKQTELVVEIPLKGL